MSKEMERDVCLYAASKSDFFAARRAAEILNQYIKNQEISEIRCYEDPVYSALHCALVICYTKPFGQNNPGVKLKIEMLDKYLQPEERSLHAELIDARDKCIAHSDHEFRNTTIYPPGTYQNKDFFYVKITNKIFPPNKIDEIYDLIVHMEKIIDFVYAAKIELLYLEKGRPSVPFDLNP